MLFSEYVAEQQKVIAEFSQSGLLFHSELTADMRTEHIGLLKGILSFSDGSTLFFKEYLDLRRAVKKCIRFIIKTCRACCVFGTTTLPISLRLVFKIINIRRKRRLRLPFLSFQVC